MAEADRWIDSHSVNCFECGELVDERDCTTGIDGEGNYCPSCLDMLELAKARHAIKKLVQWLDCHTKYGYTINVDEQYFVLHDDPKKRELVLT